MEIICVDKQTFEELLPFGRIKNKLFYKPEDVQRLLDLNYHPLIKSRL